MARSGVENGLVGCSRTTTARWQTSGSKRLGANMGGQESMKSIHIELPDKLAEALGTLVQQGWFHSEAEVLRFGPSAQCCMVTRR
jgi:hypothetical protein